MRTNLDEIARERLTPIGYGYWCMRRDIVYYALGTLTMDEILDMGCSHDWFDFTPFLKEEYR